jgi:hypothetical protein
MSRARSTIFTGLPMSSTKISPPSARDAACITSWHASGIVMKYRFMSGCVTVTGPPSSICFLNVGITLPELPSTFPNRTATNFVFDRLAMLWMYSSARRLVAPITDVGFTALSSRPTLHALFHATASAIRR